ncbi:TPA: hypothetical protein I7114_21615 [Vibrio vulnificus]|uniref:AbiH family protein n=1 Tax=Vibrio vulnificus TaxID=672 RepID=UPI0005F1C38B|nr:AbiH family protein [Vibrio vulnificus]AUJ35183.1 hypothetical protein BWZ32_09875 [Vibrio vulnificus]EGR0084608.1 hypothetical protein [Vibrio vulnificus]MBF4453682.1 hypothetical protein [Vibrio vulnificus]MBF4499489.1 hypothetical protein [Vibrio vulnificus]MBL6179043.1 hypothetical protein [Vibrio vulnificus]
MKKVFIIGNGFDLNLGLKTSYQCFISSPEFQRKVSEGNTLFNYLNDVVNVDGWIDVENELVSYSNEPFSEMNFLGEYNELCDCLKRYISSIDMFCIDKQSSAFEMLKSIDLSDDFLIVNFNYTDSVLHILEELGHENVQNKILHVHGRVATDEIVFGVDDKAGINPEHVFLYKSYSSIFGEKYDVSNIVDFEHFYFFGHSLGQSDHLYFKDMFGWLTHKGSKSKMVKFYHYSQRSKEAIVRQLQDLTNNKLGLLKMKISFAEDYSEK